MKKYWPLISTVIYTCILASMIIVASWKLSFIGLIISYFAFFAIGVSWAVIDVLVNKKLLDQFLEWHNDQRF